MEPSTSGDSLWAEEVDGSISSIEVPPMEEENRWDPATFKGDMLVKFPGVNWNHPNIITYPFKSCTLWPKSLHAEAYRMAHKIPHQPQSFCAVFLSKGFPSSF